MKRFLSLLVILCVASVANAQQVVKIETTHINGVKLAKSIVVYDATVKGNCGCQYTGVCTCGDNCQCGGSRRSLGITVQTQLRKVGRWVCKGTHCEWVAE